MAPLLPIGAGLLAALWASPHFATAADKGPKAEKVSQACGLIINVARNAKMEAFIPPVEIDSALETKAAEDVINMTKTDKKNNEEATCKDVTQPSAQYPGVLIPLKAEAEAEANADFNCSKLLSALVDVGLEQLKDYNNEVYKYNDGFFKKLLAFPPLFVESSTKFGCARTTGCKKKAAATYGVSRASENLTPNDILYCRFDPAIKEGQPPFTKEYFSALQQRKAAGIKLTDLKAEDVRTSGASAASLAIPAALAVAALFYL